MRDRALQLARILREDKDDSAREAAAYELARLLPDAPQEAVDALCEALPARSSGSLKAAAAYALGAAIGNEAALTALERGLAEREEIVRSAVVKALGKASAEHAPRVVPHLIAALDDEASRVRQSAAEALSEVGPGAEAAIPGLRRALADTDAGVQGYACRALGRIGAAASEAADEIVPVLDSEYHSSQVDAMRALGQLGALPAAAIAKLCRVLTLRGSLVEEAVRALGNTGPDHPEVVTALIAAWESWGPSKVRDAALESLDRLGPAAMLHGLDVADEAARTNALRLLLDLERGAPFDREAWRRRVLPALAVAGMGDPRPRVRAGAATCVAMFHERLLGERAAELAQSAPSTFGDVADALDASRAELAASSAAIREVVAGEQEPATHAALLEALGRIDVAEREVASARLEARVRTALLRLLVITLGLAVAAAIAGFVIFALVDLGRERPTLAIAAGAALVVALIGLALWVFRCPRCKAFFARKLTGTERLGSRSVPVQVQDARGNTVTITTTVEDRRYHYRCRRCAHEWTSR